MDHFLVIQSTSGWVKISMDGKKSVKTMNSQFSSSWMVNTRFKGAIEQITPTGTGLKSLHSVEQSCKHTSHHCYKSGELGPVVLLSMSLKIQREPH